MSSRMTSCGVLSVLLLLGFDRQGMALHKPGLRHSKQQCQGHQTEDLEGDPKICALRTPDNLIENRHGGEEPGKSECEFVPSGIVHWPC